MTNAFFRYDALKKCFQAVLDKAAQLYNIYGKQVSIHAPRIGAARAGGKWSKIEKLLVEEFINYDIPVTIYDLPNNKDNYKIR